MVIQSVSVFNFRSLNALAEIDLSSGLDILIGQNDTGKSSLLQALRIFFETERGCEFGDGGQRNDLCFHAVDHSLEGSMTVAADEIGIICVLKLDGKDLAQANSNLTPHAIGQHLTVLKKCCREPRFKVGRSDRSEAYFILKEQFKNDAFNGLDSRNQKGLIELMESFPESETFLLNTNGKGKPENAERVAALLEYAKLREEREVKFHPLSFPAKGTPDSVWPEFTMIDTKTSLDGRHKLIDDAFKKVDQTIEKDFEAEMNAVREGAEQRYATLTSQVASYARSHYLRELEDFRAIPTVKLAVARELVLKRFGQKDLSHFDQQGDGTKRRMMVAILQVSASLLAEAGGKRGMSTSADEFIPYEHLRIWAFDEPELHLHPGAQRDLFNSFVRFSKEGFQIICSTHSTVFVNNSELSSVHLVELDGNLCTRSRSQERAMAVEIKRSIGLRNSDVFFSNLFVVVEGPTETGALPILYEHFFGVKPDAAGIAIIDGKGCSAAPDRVEFLAKLGSALCLFDTDAAKGLGATAQRLEKIITFVGKADFEDAFSDRIWLEVLRENFPLQQAGETGDFWTAELLAGLRAEIDLENANKKFLKLIERAYDKSIHERGLRGEGVHPYNWEKVKIGELVARKALEIAEVPSVIDGFLKKMQLHVS